MKSPFQNGKLDVAVPTPWLGYGAKYVPLIDPPTRYVQPEHATHDSDWKASDQLEVELLPSR